MITDDALREERVAKAEELSASLRGDGAQAIALTYVDNSGVTRAKTIPVARLGSASAWGIGMSPCFDLYYGPDLMTQSRLAGGPDGDLRLFPALESVTVLAAQPGWAWAPVDRYEQDGTPYGSCQRTFVRRVEAAAHDRGLVLTASFEVEFVLGLPAPDGSFRPAAQGPAYSMTRVIEQSDFCRDLLAALDTEGVPVEQLHPEYAAGQYELSVAPLSLVGAADRTVLVKQTIRAVAARHGLRVSFAPFVVAGGLGSGAHLHLGVRRGGANLFAGGDGPHGITTDGGSFVAGVLAELPALTAIGAPAPVSYERLQPSRWAGVYACWGRETREAAVRFVTGMTGSEGRAANFEVKAFDGSANPYLVAGAVAAAGLAGLAAGTPLPPEITGDPGIWSEKERVARGVRRLPTSLGEATALLERSTVLGPVLGDPLLDTFVAVRRAEIEHAATLTPEAIVDAARWTY
ncbi:MAG: glutamine synthetase family protein [Candidatus Dormiibacterota bacterium]